MYNAHCTVYNLNWIVYIVYYLKAVNSVIMEGIWGKGSNAYDRDIVVMGVNIGSMMG